MTIKIITRHQNSIPVIKELLVEKGIDGEVKVLSHFNGEALNAVKDGDILVGILPINLIADINKKGGRFFALTMIIPAELRGVELSEEQVRDLNPSLQEYQVVAL